MENLVLSFNVMLPLFLCLMLGYLLRRVGMLEPTLLKGLNKLCFKIFLPFYLFNNVYSTDISEAFNAKLIIFSISCVVALFVILMLLIPKMEKDHRRCGVMIQGIFRSNFALFGLPVAISLCGEQNIGPTSLLLGMVVPVYNVMAVITLETFRGGKPNPQKIVKGIITNPLIIASLLGAAFNILHIQIPATVEKSLIDIGRIATPLSLIALGGEFMFSSVKGYFKQLMTVLAGKLVISPLIMVILAVLIGLRNETLVPVMIMFGAPTAVSSFPMAQQMDGDSELAASIVVFTSAFAILSIFCWIFILKQLMLI